MPPKKGGGKSGGKGGDEGDAKQAKGGGGGASVKVNPRLFISLTLIVPAGETYSVREAVESTRGN